MTTEKEVKRISRTSVGLWMISAGRLPDPYNYSSKGIRQHGIQAAGAIVAITIIWLVSRYDLAPQVLCLACGVIGLVYSGFNLLKALSESVNRRRAYHAWHGMVELNHLLMRHRLDNAFISSHSGDEARTVLRDWRELHKQDSRTRTELKNARSDRFEVLVQELFPPR